MGGLSDFGATATGPLAVLVLALHAAPAAAVDLVNRDNKPQAVVVNGDDGQSTVVTVAPRQKVAGVCGACVILAGGSAVEASGDVTVTVEGGKVSIGSKR